MTTTPLLTLHSNHRKCYFVALFCHGQWHLKYEKYTRHIGPIAKNLLERNFDMPLSYRAVALDMTWSHDFSWLFASFLSYGPVKSVIIKISKFCCDKKFLTLSVQDILYVQNLAFILLEEIRLIRFDFALLLRKYACC